MFEARLTEALVLKKLLDAVKELVTDVNLDCSDAGISLQSMDSSHACLVTFLLKSDGFESYRCDRSLSIGLNVVSLGKIVKAAANDDVVTIKADQDTDLLNIVFESPKSERVSEYDMKLMDIDSEHLGVDEDDKYTCTVTFASSEFQRIMRDLSIFGENTIIEVLKSGITFSNEGDIGKGTVTLKNGAKAVDSKSVETKIEIDSPISLAFSTKFLTNFTKATGLSETVVFKMSSELPLMIEYSCGEVGYVRYYIACKQEDDS